MSHRGAPRVRSRDRRATGAAATVVGLLALAAVARNVLVLGVDAGPGAAVAVIWMAGSALIGTTMYTWDRAARAGAVGLRIRWPSWLGPLIAVTPLAVLAVALVLPSGAPVRLFAGSLTTAYLLVVAFALLAGRLSRRDT